MCKKITIDNKKFRNKNILNIKKYIKIYTMTIPKKIIKNIY